MPEVGIKPSLVHTGRAPWRGRGTKITQSMKWEEACELPLLKWDVSLRPSGYVNSAGQFITATVDIGEEKVVDKYHVVRSDNGEIIGTVGKGFVPVQNMNLFAQVNAAVEGNLMTFEVVGTLKHGQIIWALAKLPGCITVKGEDVVNKYILLANAHDGSMRMMVMITPIRLGCINTLPIAIREADSMFAARHTKSIASRMLNMKDVLGLADKWYRDFEDLTQKLVNKRVTSRVLDTYLDNLGYAQREVRDPVTELISKQDTEAREDIKYLFEYGVGNVAPGIKGTAWALLNGVTEYVDHHRATRVQGGSEDSEEARLMSAWFQHGRDLKVKALELVTAL